MGEEKHFPEEPRGPERQRSVPVIQSKCDMDFQKGSLLCAAFPQISLPQVFILEVHPGNWHCEECLLQVTL